MIMARVVSVHPHIAKDHQLAWIQINHSCAGEKIQHMTEALTSGGKAAGDNAWLVLSNKQAQGHRVSSAQSPEKQDDPHHFPQILGTRKNRTKPKPTTTTPTDQPINHHHQQQNIPKKPQAETHFPRCSNHECNMPRGQKCCAVVVYLVPSPLLATDGGTQQTSEKHGGGKSCTCVSTAATQTQWWAPKTGLAIPEQPKY